MTAQASVPGYAPGQGGRSGMPDWKPYCYRAGATKEDHARMDALREQLDAEALRQARLERAAAGGADVLVREAIEAEPDVAGAELGRRLGLSQAYAARVKRAVLEQMRGEEEQAAVPLPPGPVTAPPAAAVPAPPSAAPAERCKDCGYLLATLGHKIACGGAA